MLRSEGGGFALCPQSAYPSGVLSQWKAEKEPISGTNQPTYSPCRYQAQNWTSGRRSDDRQTTRNRGL